MSALTHRQTEILNYLHETLKNTGAPPTRADICAAFGFSSPNAAETHLRAIAARGYIEMIPGSARGIRLRKLEREHRPSPFELPLIGSIAAGSPIAAEENVDTRLAIDPDLFRPRADFLHRVSGHSMNLADILDGDLVGIHAQEDANNGQIIAAVLPDPKTGQDMITLKRYSRRGSKLILKPESTDASIEPIEIDLASFDPESQESPPFRIAGIYAGHLRSAR